MYDDFQDAARTLHWLVLDAWNNRDAEAFADLFAPDGSVVGFDGTMVNGRDEIESHLERIFGDHEVARYVRKVREVRSLTPSCALLRAVVGMVPPGKSDLDPATNAVQSLVVVESDGHWWIALLHNTPAAFHDRPEEVERLTDELRAELQTA